MHLSMSLSMQPKLIMKQRLKLKHHLLSLRLALIQALREEEYKPEGVCPNCDKHLTLLEILQGFRPDPNDYTTECPKCEYRFEPIMVCIGIASRIEVPFYCSDQTLSQLKGKEGLTAKEIHQQHAAIYHSAIVHHGSLASAFHLIGIKYTAEDPLNWQHRVLPFLGRLPDTTIAKFTNATATSVRMLRLEHKIPAYNSQRALKEAEQE
jgi:hypothetical protein